MKRLTNVEHYVYDRLLVLVERGLHDDDAATRARAVRVLANVDATLLLHVRRDGSCRQSQQTGRAAIWAVSSRVPVAPRRPQ